MGRETGRKREEGRKEDTVIEIEREREKWKNRDREDERKGTCRN